MNDYLRSRLDILEAENAKLRETVNRLRAEVFKYHRTIDQLEAENRELFLRFLRVFEEKQS